MSHRLPEPDKPWLMRTYAGHSTARASNELYRGNLAKGQTGLSVAFDLPTQTGYDADHELARGEVGKVGVPVAHKGDMHALMDGIPLDQMNTSMTINATAAWLLALYMVVAEENGIDRRGAPGHDPERHHQGVPLARHVRVPARPVDAADRRHGRLHGRARPALEPGQHLLVPPAGGGRDAGAGDRLLDVDRRSRCSTRSASACRRTAWARCSGGSRSSSTPASGSSRSTRSCARWPSCGTSWAASATACTDERHRRFRYGVQVNSLGLTESQPENNVQRIVLEALAVTLGRNARARAIQLPAWNEALGLPAPVGPAVVAADPAGARVRDRHPRVPRHLRGLEGDGRARRRAARGRPRRDGARGRAGRRRRGRAVHEGRARRVAAARGSGGSSAASRSWSASTASRRPRRRR